MSGVVRKGQRQDIGYPRAFAFEALEDFAKNIQAILDQPGPVFVAMKVMPEIETDVHPWKWDNPLILKESLERCSDYMGFLLFFKGLRYLVSHRSQCPLVLY